MSNGGRSIIVIPARMGSTRFPGKPLADINGRPMIVHVWERCMEADLGPVVVACCESEVAEAVRDAGGEAVMTSSACPSGSDRVWEAVQMVDPESLFPIVVNVQGDLPTVEPSAIRAAVQALAQPEVDIATLVVRMSDPQEIESPDVVKAVLALPVGVTQGRALYFSRAKVPHGPGPFWHHIGLYAFRRSALQRFVALPVGVLEQQEALEQLRALEHGMRIDCAVVDTVPLGVDTPRDLVHARALLAVRHRASAFAPSTDPL